MNITTRRITGKHATPLATEFAAISREQGRNVQFTHGGLFRYVEALDLADLHVVATSAQWYFDAKGDESRRASAKRIADGIAYDYHLAFGRPVPGPATVSILKLTGHGAATLVGGAS